MAGNLTAILPLEDFSFPGLAGFGYVKVLALFAAFPAVVIILNVLSQLLLPRDKSHPPLVFHWVPIIGSAIEYGMDPLQFFERCRDKYGNVFTFVLLGRRMTVALGPKGSNLILGGKLSEVSAEEAYTPLTTPVFGPGVVYDCPNHMLMEQKKFVKYGLSTENFRAYVGMIEDEIVHFINHDPTFSAFHDKKSTEWGTFPAFKTCSEMTIFTASRTLQGPEIRAALDKSFADLYHDLDNGFTPINWLMPNLPLPSYRRRDAAQKAMSDFYVGIIQKRRAENRMDERDMMAALCGQKYKDGRAVTDRDVAHMLTALLMAGQHTSSSSVSWTLMHLAHNHSVAEALYEEQVKHFSNPDGTLRSMTYEELKDLPVLDGIVRETLRLHSPIHTIMRTVISDIVVPRALSAPSEDGQYIIPRGHTAVASPAFTQVDRKIWKNHDEWDPYRWIDPNGEAAQALQEYLVGEKVDYGYGLVSKGTESVYQPFGAGRHRCIGEHFAYLQVGCILATLVRHLEFHLDEVPDTDYSSLFSCPKGACMVKYRHRVDTRLK